MVKVVLINDPARSRSKDLLTLCKPGFDKLKIPFKIGGETHIPKAGEIIIWWGMPGWAIPYYKLCLENWATPVVVDLGYWNRKTTDQNLNALKIAPNYWHPTPYVMQHNFSGDRYRASAPTILPPSTSGNWLTVASMSSKSAPVYGHRTATFWDSDTISAIRTKFPKATICYRVKPSWRDGDQARIVGVDKYSYGSESVSFVLDQSRAVVTHHSNVAVDALIRGVPAFCKVGAAAAISPYTNPDQLENPILPDSREQFLYNLAHFNWFVDEIREGLPWLHMAKFGLIPL